MTVDIGAAVVLSLQVATLSVVLLTPPSIAIGWVLARRDFPGKSIVTAIVMTPMVVPPVVTGLALLDAFGRGGPLHAPLAALGLEVAFAPAGAVVAAGLVSLPLYVLSVRNAVQSVDPRLEDVAATLGATPWRTFRRVTLPLALPGVAAGAVLSFARALGEFGATAVVAGNIEGRTRTISMAVYTLLETPNGDATAHQLAWISVGLSLVALGGYELLQRKHNRRLEVATRG